MSDFDKFFAEKLDEEVHYPGRAKNWRSLNQRLDAFVTGTSVGGAVGSVAWKAVSVVLLATTALLVWKYATLQKEHGQMQQQQQKLEQQIAELQRPAVQQPGQQQVDQQIAELQQPAAQQPKQQQSLERQIAELQQQLAQQLKQQRNLEQQIAELRQPAQQPRQQQSLERQVAELQQQLAQQLAQQRNLEQQITELQRPAAQQPTPTGSAVTQSDASPAAPQGTSIPPAFSEKKDSTADAERAAAVPAVFPEKKDSVGAAERAAAVFQPSPLAPHSTPLDTSAKSAQATTPLPIIKPLRERFQLRAGIGALVGWEQPRQQGISLITGQGISASVSLWRSGLWLTTGADWVRFEEKSDQYWPKFHQLPQPPKSPGMGGPGPGPHPSDKLVSVESQQRQQRYHLGLRYALPRLLGIRLTLQSGHVWAHTAPTFVQYVFEDHDPGPSPGHKLDFLTLKEEARKYRNIWQAGLGLEYDLPAWTLSLRADYQAQSKAVKPTFDAMFLRAGLEYRIR